jgi:putative transposase
MSTYTQILYQIVFSTRSRERTLKSNNRDQLFMYISGILQNKKCHLYRINGVEDHLHIITHLHPEIALSNLIKDIKLASTAWIKENKIFPRFVSWQEGYGAFTYNIKEKDRLINYVNHQEEHHKIKTFEEEYKVFLQENDIVFNEKYLL